MNFSHLFCAADTRIYQLPGLGTSFSILSENIPEQEKKRDISDPVHHHFLADVSAMLTDAQGRKNLQVQNPEGLCITREGMELGTPGWKGNKVGRYWLEETLAPGIPAAIFWEQREAKPPHGLET